MQQMHVYLFEYHELNDLVQTKLNWPEFNVAEYMEWPNDTYHLWDASAQTYLSHRETIDRVIENHEYGYLHEILHKLCFLGHVPQGDILISVSW